jgi:insulysin
VPFCEYHRLTEFKPELIQEIIDTMVPEQARLWVISKKFEAAEGLHTEQWYGTQWRSRRFTPEQLKRWTAASAVGVAELHLPTPNCFIPTVFTIVNGGGSEAAAGVAARTGGGAKGAAARTTAGAASPTTPAHPQLVRDTPLSKVWHKLDAEFGTPKASIMVALTSPVAYSSPDECNMVGACFVT